MFLNFYDLHFNLDFIYLDFIFGGVMALFGFVLYWSLFSYIWKVNALVIRMGMDEFFIYLFYLLFVCVMALFGCWENQGKNK